VASTAINTVLDAGSIGIAFNFSGSPAPGVRPQPIVGAEQTDIATAINPTQYAGFKVVPHFAGL